MGAPDSTDAFSRLIANAPEDDEPLAAEDEQAIAEGEADYAAGRTIPLEQIERELDLGSG
jgi:predicted transcriptional regulator